MKKLMMTVFLLLAGTTWSATTYVWTGAADGFWTNAANWTVGGAVATVAPGVPWSEVSQDEKKIDVISSDGLARRGEKVEFGACSGTTTIDFDGLYSIGSVTVKAGAPAYVLGTSSSQVLPLESNAKLLLESGLENFPTLTAVLSLGRSITRDATVTVENKTGREFTIGDLGDFRTTDSTGWGFSYLILAGTGNFRFAGSHVSDQGVFKSLFRLEVQAPKLTVAHDVDNLSYLALTKADVNVEILEGCALIYGSGNGNQLYATASGCSVTGKGVLRFNASPLATTTSRARVYATGGYELEIDVPFEVAGASKGVEPDLNIYGNDATSKGTVYFSGENRAKGAVAFIDGVRTLKGSDIGLPTNELVKFYVSGTLAAAFVTNATLARTFTVANAQTATIANVGATNLAATIAVTPLSDGTTATLCAKAETKPLALDATYAAGQSVTLLIDGASVVSPSAATLSGAAAIRLAGGTLDASAAANWSPIVPVTFETGAATIVVPDGETYVFSSLARSDSKGTLDLVCGTGRVKVTGATAGASVTGVTVNGLAAAFREGGVIAPVAPAYDVAIAARGDTVPNAPTQIVGITTDGSGANDAIAADATAVKGLVQIANAAATVAIGEGRNLAAGKVTLAGFAGNLDIGAADDLGTFGKAGAGVLLENDDLVNDLTVRAKLADGACVMVQGTTRAPVLAGGSAATNDVIVETGALTVTGERRFFFNLLAAGTNKVVSSSDPADWPTVRFDGAKDVIVGERGLHASYQFLTKGYSDSRNRGRLVITNSLIRSDDINRVSYYAGIETTFSNEYHAIVIGNRAGGWLDIQEGAVISNRLIVGGPVGGHRGLAVARQTGGTVAALGDYLNKDSARNGSGISICNTQGYYSLERGTLTALGGFHVGGSAGFLRQQGGTFSVVRHPGDAEQVGNVAFHVGDLNNGDGHYWISGGTADVSTGGLIMCGGYFKAAESWATVTVDGTAFLDAGDKTIAMINTGRCPLLYPHLSIFNIGGTATVRATGFFDYSRDSDDDIAAETEETKKNRVVVVNFDGGTFKTGANGKPIFHDFNTVRHAKDGAIYYWIDHVVVHKGGMTVDTDGKTGNFIDVPLEGATGGGIAAIDYVPTSAELAYDIPPVIEIEGDGYGATAAVDWDAETRTVKAVKITSPGKNYTEAKAIFRIGSRSNGLVYSVVTSKCEIASNANTGSFTKKGEGDLTFEAVNAYGGDTVLAGGTLRVAVTGALPEGSALVPQGGILEVADGVTLPEAITVKLQNPSKDAKIDLIRFLGDVPSTLPIFTIQGAEGDNWRVTCKDKTLRVSYARGFEIIVR